MVMRLCSASAPASLLDASSLIAPTVPNSNANPCRLSDSALYSGRFLCRRLHPLFTLESPNMPHFTCDVYVRAADGQVLAQPYTAPTKRGIIRYLDSRFKSPQSAYDIAKVRGRGTLIVEIMMLTTPV